MNSTIKLIAISSFYESILYLILLYFYILLKTPTYISIVNLFYYFIIFILLINFKVIILITLHVLDYSNLILKELFYQYHGTE